MWSETAVSEYECDCVGVQMGETQEMLESYRTFASDFSLKWRQLYEDETAKPEAI